MKKKKLQSFGWKNIETSGICCAHCRQFQEGMCQNKFVDQRMVDPAGYQYCLEPENELLLKAVTHVKELLYSEDLPKSKRVKYLYALVDRFEGAPRTQVESDYKLYSILEDGRKKSNYAQFMKRAIGFLASYIPELECAAIAKWILDDGYYALYEWNPFDRGIEKIKVDMLNKCGRSYLNTIIYMDDIQYRVLDQERGNLFVVAEMPEESVEGIDAWFLDSWLEEYLNTDWLEQHPETKKRLIHRIRILTVDNIRDYGETITRVKEPYWVSIMPDDAVMNGSGKGIVHTGRKNEIMLQDTSEKALLRPAFWISPTEADLQRVKEDITKKVSHPKEVQTDDSRFTRTTVRLKQQENQLLLAPGSISWSLTRFKEHENIVSGMTVSDLERDIYQKRLIAELSDIFKLSALDQDDFEILCGIRNIKTKLNEERK